MVIPPSFSAKTIENEPVTLSKATRFLMRVGKPRSLRNILVLWFLVLALLPVAVVTWVSYQQTQVSLTQAYVDKLEWSVRLNGEYIQRWFDDRLKGIEAQSRGSGNIKFFSALKNGLESSGESVAEYIQSAAWAKTVILGQGDLLSFNQQYAYVADLLLVDLNGNVLFTRNREINLGSNLFTDAAGSALSIAIKSSLQSGQTRFSDLVYDGTSQPQLVGFITVPITNRVGHQLGVLAIKFEENSLVDILDQGNDKGAQQYLVGEDAILRSSGVASKKENEMQAFKAKPLPLKLDLLSENIQNSVHSTRIFEFMDFNDQPVFGLIYRIKIANINWYLVNTLDQKSTLASGAWFSLATIWVAIISGVCSISLSIYLARNLAKPVTHLVEASRAEEKGTLTPRVDVGGYTEAINLAEFINQRITKHQLQHRVIEESRHLTRKALIELEDQKFALDQHAAVAVTDADGTIISANELFIQLSGYSNEELVGQNHRLLKSGTHNKEFWAAVYAFIGCGKVWHGEVCNKSKCGNLYWVDITIVPIMKKGRPYRYVAIRTDITQRKEAELARQKALSWLEATLESSDNGIVVTDEKRALIQLNKRFSELWGIPDLLVTNGDLQGMLACVKEKLVDPKGFIRGVDLLQNDLTITAFDTIELTDGRVIERESKPMIIAGKPQGRVWSFRDITQHKRNEKVMLDAKDAAETAVLAKSEFLASMSHEIRTPMNGVLGMLGLLLSSNLNKDQQHKAELAQSSARSLLALINDILDFSKVEAGKLDLEELSFNLRDMLGDFAEAMALRTQEKGLELILDISAINHSMVRGDPGRLRQILTNLVGNAIKFTETGEILIRAKLLSSGESGYIFTCSVMDTGIGISSDKKAGLFDQFTQVDASTTRRYGGTGLGLSIVKRLCELMGGSISVSSTFGSGSSFDFSIALRACQSSQQVAPKVDMSTLSLLIVDDNYTNCKVLKSQLERWGSVVEEASEGFSALALISERLKKGGDNLYDAAFLDMRMPVVSGAELGRLIRGDERCNSMKLIMMTSMGHRGDAIKFANLGFQAYFPKPATTADLFDALSVVVSEGEVLKQADPLVTRHYLRSLSQSKEIIDSANDDHGDNESMLALQWPESTRLLLVEDNRINQEVALGVLEGINLSTDLAGDGKEAMEMLVSAPDKNPYTLVLMDCQMPTMDGFEASRRIRLGQAGSRNQEIPIIAVTANVMKGDKEKCISVGMSDYISKPIEVEDVTRVLRKWLLMEGNMSAAIGDPQIIRDLSDDQSNKIFQSENTAASVWNMNEVLKRVGGKDEKLRRIIGLYFDEIPRRIDSLQIALHESSWDEAYGLAHGIKGALANLSSVQMLNIIKELELSIKGPNHENALNLMLELIESQGRFESVLSRYLSGKSFWRHSPVDGVDDTLEKMNSNCSQTLLDNQPTPEGRNRPSTGVES